MAVAAAMTIGAALISSGSAAADTPPPCAAPSPGGPVQVTADCVDTTYATAVIDTVTDETVPVAYHKVAGHFDGTDMKFTIYLPPAAQWQGRFFQYTYPLTDQNADNRAIGFAIASGGYAVQAGNATVSLGYRHAAAAAKFAKTVAAQYYASGSRPIHGYLYGPSGGSFQTIGAAENTTGVWDGFVPMVMGVPMSTPYTFFIRAMARLLLADKAGQIKNAVSPGGSGNPSAGLDAAQRAMLKELTAFGVPLRAWENPDYLLGLSAPDGLLGFGGIVKSIDPSYVTDFWTKPGYLGTEQSPLGDVVRAALTKAGDTADNRWDIALRAYYRYQVPPSSDGYYGFDQFRAADGVPIYPQRPLLIGPLILSGSSGNAGYTGHVNGKVIVVDSLYDVDAMPWHADWYAQRVKAALGSTAFANQFRLYFTDHADHLEAAVSGTRATYLITYFGNVEQTLRDLAAWVEKGDAAPQSTRYRVQGAQIVVPDNAAARRGIQPTVNLAVDDASSVVIAAGKRVSFTGRVNMPPGTGTVVATAWDFEGDGTYTETPLRKPQTALDVETTHRFDVPGTYYVALRVTAQRSGVDGPFTKVQNLDRVRVTVR